MKHVIENFYGLRKKLRSLAREMLNANDPATKCPLLRLIFHFDFTFLFFIKNSILALNSAIQCKRPF